VSSKNEKNANIVQERESWIESQVAYIIGGIPHIVLHRLGSRQDFRDGLGVCSLAVTSTISVDFLYSPYLYA
jgi:hypothetical protein